MKNKLIKSIALAISIFCVLTLQIKAQSAKSAESKQSEKIEANHLLSDYIKISSLPMNERPKFFSELSPESKASFFKLQMAMQFVKRPNLNLEQKDMILDALSMISAQSYDRSSPENRAKGEQDAMTIQQKSMKVFRPNEAYEIFAGITGGTRDVELLQKYQEAVSSPKMTVRRKFFRESTPENRSEIWKAQMAYYLATKELNKNQQEFILKVISLTTPETFTFPSKKGEEKSNARKSFEALEEEALKLFTKEDMYTIFMSLGEPERILSKGGEPEPDLAPGPRDCGCTWWCLPCTYCRDGGCDETTSGCGWTLGSPCTGKCVVDINTCPR